MSYLLTSQDLKKEFPPSPKNLLFLSRTKKTIANILQKKDPRKLLILGPCSLHDEKAFLEYAYQIKALALTCQHFFIIVRFFYEKPRTQNNWKGFLSDPFLDGSFQIEKALQKTRALMLKMADLELPIASELLDPLSFNYFQDLISFGIIGARTSSSPIHRQLASLADFPMGFKNTLEGDIDSAVNGALFARESHTFLHVNNEGRLCKVLSKGNQLTSVILRGSQNHSNFQQAEELFKKLEAKKIFCPLIIDCAHGNSRKDLEKQKVCFQKTLEKKDFIAGLMLESFLNAGQQPLKLPLNLLNPLKYGVSVTDPCLSLKETQGLILEAEKSLSSSSLSMSIS